MQVFSHTALSSVTAEHPGEVTGAGPTLWSKDREAWIGAESVCSGRISKVKSPPCRIRDKGGATSALELQTHGTDTLIEELLLLSEPLIFTALAA
jgi:hypothetical protein